MILGFLSITQDYNYVQTFILTGLSIIGITYHHKL